ncbi:MAG TPA: glycoside hydrolase family 3 N-terminal domain-containing protein, partial [Mycobacterium sp.]
MFALRSRSKVPGALLAVMASASLALGCAPTTEQPEASASRLTMAAGAPNLAPPAAPAPPAPAAPVCGDPATMSTRDKLAQLLMVGVTGAADARAVVDTQHVGGIMIGSWTDLSMLSDGSLTDIAASAGPLPLAVSVDE